MSKKFQQTVKNNNYTLRTTGAYTSAQNGLAEKPNQDLAKIMRSLLFSSGLNSKFWSYALRHSVYLKNRRPHASLQYMTPYERMNGKKPDLSRLRIFGSRVQVQSEGKRKMKLDSISSSSLFMTYKGTDKLCYVVDDDGKNERASAHVSFDEAHLSEPPKQRPPMSKILEHAGYQQEYPKKGIIDDVANEVMNVQLLSEHATLPSKGSKESAGFDLYSAENALIEPGETKLVHTDISFAIPRLHFGQITSCSGLALKHQVFVQGGTIDADYRGEIGIILSNHSKKQFVIHRGDRVAQIVFMKIPDIKSN